MPDASEITFEQFLMSLATAALVHLGQVPHPESNETKVDLEQAKQNIDLLGLIREKTQGNLSESEKALVEGMLGQLRMQYVSLSSDAKA